MESATTSLCLEWGTGLENIYELCDQATLQKKMIFFVYDLLDFINGSQQPTEKIFTSKNWFKLMQKNPKWLIEQTYQSALYIKIKINYP